MADTHKGYVVAVADFSGFYIPNALHIERDDDSMIFDSDEDAAKAAEQDGVKLIYGMELVPDGVYLDTPENRSVIIEGLEKHPEYKDVVAYGHILEDSETTPSAGMCFGKG